MPKFARVENDVVQEVLVADKLPPFHPTIAKQWVLTTDGTQPGHVRHGSMFVASEPAKLDPVAARLAEYPNRDDVLSALAAVVVALASGAPPSAQAVALLEQVIDVDAKYPKN